MFLVIMFYDIVKEVISVYVIKVILFVKEKIEVGII